MTDITKLFSILLIMFTLLTLLNKIVQRNLIAKTIPNLLLQDFIKNNFILFDVFLLKIPSSKKFDLDILFILFSTLESQNTSLALMTRHKKELQEYVLVTANRPEQLSERYSPTRQGIHNLKSDLKTVSNLLDSEHLFISKIERFAFKEIISTFLIEDLTIASIYEELKIEKEKINKEQSKKRTKTQNWMKTLGLSEADLNELPLNNFKKLKTTRNRLLKKYHPDKAQDASNIHVNTEMTKEILQAYTEALNFFKNKNG